MPSVQTSRPPFPQLGDSILEETAKGVVMVSAQTVAAKSSASLATKHSKRLSMSVVRQQQRGATADDVAFHRWRPSSHLIAPSGWMNDPCGPSYDPRTGSYHMWYQWNPKGSTWGNMSWGHAKSKDLVHWQSSREAVIEPGTEYDHKGIFTGCVLMRSPGAEGEDATQDGQMTAIYTAVSHLPIHHTLDYHRGAEKLALSTSSDGGQTWTPHGCILDGPPAEVDIISWRDPYIAPWPLLDELLGKSSPGLYGLIAGGLKDKTPTVFAYSIDPSDLSSWDYLGHLCDVGRNQKSAPHGVDLGKNWEVCNFFSVKDDCSVGQQEDYLLINVEGCTAPNPARGAIFMKFEPTASIVEGSPLSFALQPTRSGMLDHGCLYAASSFHDETKDRRIMWGWITEDDLPEDQYDRQGWSGCLALPRELFYHPSADELGIRPLEEVLQLRDGATHSQHRFDQLQHSEGSRSVLLLEDDSEIAVHAMAGDVSGRSLEMLATVPAGEEQTGATGFVLAHSADLSTRTLVYLTVDHRVVVDRSGSAGKAEILSKGIEVKTDKIDVQIPRLRNGAHAEHQLRIFLDNSVLEVFVDDMVAISTRIYPDDGDIGVSVLGGGTGAAGTLEVWQGLSKAHAGFFA